MVTDVPGRPQGAHLGAVQGGAPGSVMAEGARRFPAGIQPGHAGLPVAVHLHAAVVVLGAYADFQVLRGKVNAVIPVQGDGRGVDGPQALQGRGSQRAAVFQVLPRLRGEVLRGEARGVAGVVHVHPAARVLLRLHQDIHSGGTLRLAGVKGPLIALQESVLQGFPFPHGLGQKFPLHPLGVHGHISRNGLLVAAGDVPAEAHRGQAVLPAVQVGPRGPGLKGHAAHAELALRVHPVEIDARGAAGGQDHLGAADAQHRVVPKVQALQAAHAPFIRKDAVGQQVFPHPHPPGQDAFFQGLGHVAAGEGPGGGGPAALVVVGLVAHEFPHFVAGKGHPQLHQLEESLGRPRGLAQSQVPVHVLPVQGVGHVLHAVALPARQGELVVGLLVAAGVAGGAVAHVLRHQQHILRPQGGQPVRGVEPRAAGAHHRRQACDFPHGHSLLRAKPPSASSTCPAE